MAAPTWKINATDEELRVALESANLPTLLVVLAQLTGDRSWLADPYRPSRTKALDDNDSAGLPPQRRAEVRAAAWEVLRRWRDGALPEPPVPDETEIVEWLSACMGEPVPAEYGRMMAEEAGFRPRDAAWSDAPPARVSDFRVVVIGAGISGICAAIKLGELGIPYVVVEKNERVGGTGWRTTTPAGVGTPSQVYSFSFAPNPNWSRYYAKQGEILDYLTEVSERYGIDDNIWFGTEVTSATFDTTNRRWEVATRDVDGMTHTVTADAVISSVGQLNRPQVPTIPGQETVPAAGRATCSARGQQGVAWARRANRYAPQCSISAVTSRPGPRTPSTPGSPPTVSCWSRSRR